MTNEDKFETLRQKALHHFVENPGDIFDIGDIQNLDELITELSIHQFELEAQNQELVQSQHDLNISNRNFSTLFRDAPIPYVIIDRNGIIQGINNKFKSLFDGVTNFDVPRDRNLQQYIDGDTLSNYLNWIQSLDTYTEDCIVKLRTNTTEDRYAKLSMSSDIIYNDMKVSLVTCADVSEMVALQKELSRHKKQLEQQVEARTQELREALEAANQANKARTAFFAQVSHEIRTPMHGILSFAGFGIKKIDTAPKEKLLEYFTLIKKSGERLLLLLNDMLDLAKYESHDLAITKSRNDLVAVYELCQLEFKAKLEELRLNVKVRKPNSAAITVFDAHRIHQVIVNLLSNAIKYSPPNSVVEVEVAQKNGSVEFSVLDQGTGIPDEELDTIFEPFVQSSENKKDAGGTGLGLAICKQIIDLHDGKIWAENVASKGAKFSFTLPIIQSLE